MQRQSWEQGVASHAMLDLGETALAAAMAHDAVTRQNAAGKLAEIDDSGIVNCGAVGEVVHWAAVKSGDTRLSVAYRQQLERLLREAARAADGTLFHLEGSREIWIDTIYMVLPLLVVNGSLAAAMTQLDGHRSRLFDTSSGLYGWRFDEDSRRTTHPEHWGTGNGWVVAAIARSVHLLAGEHPDFTRTIAAHARAVIDACLAHRDADGLFHNIVDDNTTFSEGNLAQMLAYSILTGVLDNWLPTGYADIGRSLVRTARGLVDDRGFVTGVCGAPRFDRSGTSAEAQSFFLLATNAERRLDRHLAEE